MPILAPVEGIIFLLICEELHLMEYRHPVMLIRLRTGTTLPSNELWTIDVRTGIFSNTYFIGNVICSGLFITIIRQLTNKSV
jgi:hypothetical protein